ncbi:MAG: Glycosyl transferase family 2 [Candidatus Moranbacteria bacterium GW2011_GWC1_45_18]|nr:MAG: Glycosyl transferase family 2 [Candidatus Moranbacteria bacterium GW2011_GWC2_40_12]KKT33400.1 MAG: Glycosyl transferase family 2 [Candidatus Moranbacteria bacterium GW2011_GWF2_44_10]KKT99901.1 MAG: Glycosyl transferase family 2 [Candidatus Moranbacteria bacterium GW2011_GWC1_45_18]HBB37015.1 hypothetical protein [Candidatus Moranbacteria bacterium]HBU24972.1 hypothetical protein [Candidatus Moranbacteria bacterium]
MNRILRGTALNNFGKTSQWFAFGILKFREKFGQILIVAAGIVFLFLLTLVKSKTSPDFRIEPTLFIYTIFVSSFALSRLVGAIFYEASFSRVASRENIDAVLKGIYQPFVTFVIPCKNEEKDIANTVRKCFEADYPREKTEIIVINDGSTDKTIDVLRGLEASIPSMKIIDWKINRGKRHAMAEGFRQAKGEIVVQLDSDSFIDPGSFYHLLVPFAEPEIGAVCAHADPQNSEKNILTKMQAAYYFMSFRILKAAESTFLSVFCCSGCSSAYRKDLVLPILDRWTNEKFLGLPATWGDDRSLTSWILKSGSKTIYTDEVQAYTIVPEKVKQLMKQQLRWKKSWIVNAIITSRFIFKKQPFVALFYFLPLIIISLVTPFMALRALIYLPVFQSEMPYFYILGVLLVTSLFALYCLILEKRKTYWPYLFLWSLLNFFVLAPLLIYAAIRIQDRGWGTR